MQNNFSVDDLLKSVKYFATQCCIETFFGHTIFLKFRIGYLSDTLKPPIVVAEGLNAFGRGYLCLLKQVLFLSICKLCFI